MPQSSILGNVGNVIRHPLDSYYNWVAPPVTAAPPQAPLWQQQPSQFVPDAFPQSQQVKRYDAGSRANFIAGHVYNNANAFNAGAFTGPLKTLAKATGLDNIYTRTPAQREAAGSTSEPADMWQTTAHEAGHSIWNELTPEQRASWNKLHAEHPHMLDAFYGGDPNAADFYSKNPAHAFADAYGQYAAQGDTLQNTAPEAYNFIRDASGFEYKRPTGSMMSARLSWGK